MTHNWQVLIPVLYNGCLLHLKNEIWYPNCSCKYIFAAQIHFLTISSEYNILIITLDHLSIVKKQTKMMYWLVLPLLLLYLELFWILPFDRWVSSCIASEARRTPPTPRRCRWSTSACSRTRTPPFEGSPRTDNSTFRT